MYAETIRTGQERPVGAIGKELISVRGLLEWAFGVECASLDFDEVGDVLFGRMPSCGAEYRIASQLALGKRRGEGVRPDTSFGHSHPHDDAEIAVTVLRNSVAWPVAVWVAQLARAGRAPDWDLGTPRLVPRDWGKTNQHGRLGKTEVIRTVRYRAGGRMRERKDLYVPCRWVPSAGEVASARRAWLDWWSALHSVRCGLAGADLRRFEVTDRLPPRTPWAENC